MHRGTILATMLCAAAVIGVAVWMLLSPLMKESYAVRLYKAETNQTVLCAAAFANEFIPGNHASYPVSICVMSCERHGFTVVGRPTVGVIDFISADRFRQAQIKWARYIPSVCRPDVSQFH